MANFNELSKTVLEYIMESRNLTKEFRMVIGEKDGHLYKVVFDLNPNNITSDNLDTGKGKEELQKNIKTKGHSNYTSLGNKVIAIVDMCNNKRVNQVSGFPPIHNSGGSIKPINERQLRSLYKRFGCSEDEINKIVSDNKKECPTGIFPDPGFEDAIEKSKKKGQHAIVYTVGKVDNTDTYKTTDPKKVTKGMLNL